MTFKNFKMYGKTLLSLHRHSGSGGHEVMSPPDGTTRQAAGKIPAHSVIMFTAASH